MTHDEIIEKAQELVTKIRSSPHNDENACLAELVYLLILATLDSSKTTVKTNSQWSPKL